MTQRDGSVGIAESMRQSPPAIDDVRRARMEKRLLDAVRRGARSRAPAPRRRGAFALVGSALALAAAALIGWLVWPRGGSPVARFSIEAGGSRPSGTVAVGSTLEVGEGERAQVRAFGVEVAVEGGSAIRFASLEAAEVRLELSRGAVEVEFHPRERGRERLSIETPSARVEVVGTIFSVAVEGATTRVRVTQGVVRVLPRGRSASAVELRAGESVAIDGAIAAASVDRATAVAHRDAPTEALVQAEGPGADAPGASGTTAAPSPAAIAGGAGATAPMHPIDPALDEQGAPAEVLRPDVVPVSPRQRLRQAQDQIQAGRHEEGRALLESLVRDPDVPIDARIEAQTSIGDSFQRDGDTEAAIDAYRRAYRLGGRRSAAGMNALFSLARALERSGHRDEARRLYLEYLASPRGANADLARRAVCELGGAPELACPSPSASGL